MDKKMNMVCIVCPRGCHLEIKINDKNGAITDKNIRVHGNLCLRGKNFAIEEVLDPKRVIATTVVIEGAKQARLPVKTEEAIPKELMFKAMDEINSIRVKAPISIGDVVLNNLLGLGIDVVATRSMN